MSRKPDPYQQVMDVLEQGGHVSLGRRVGKTHLKEVLAQRAECTHPEVSSSSGEYRCVACGKLCYPRDAW